MRTLIDAGHEVHLMTGSRRATFDKEVESMGIEVPFTHFFSIADTLIEKKQSIDLKDPDNPWCLDKELWDRQKGDYAKRAGVHFMIDDEPDYAPYFLTSFMLFKGDKNQEFFDNAAES